MLEVSSATRAPRNRFPSGAPVLGDRYGRRVAVAASTIERLQRALRGPVLGANDPGYDVARTTFNALTDRRPAVIACCAGSDDVAAAVDFASRVGMPVAIRGGGHSVAGHSVCEGGLVIDLRLMHQVQVDAESRRVSVGGGANWRDVDAPCAAHSLAMPGGTYDTTGVAGLTLGGGIGHLIGMHGLTLDNLVSAEVVLADGSLVTASEAADADLLWALRGGGGNFGVVTEFEFELHPLPAAWGGVISFAQPHVGDAVRLFRDVMASAPDELVMMVSLREAAAHVMVCFAGDAAAGEETVGPLREQLPALRDRLGLTSYLQIQVMQGDTPFGLRHYWKSHFVRSLTDDLIDELVEHYLARPRDGDDEILIEQMHGAALRVPADATAFSRRQPCFNVSALAIWDDATQDGEHIAWARRTAAAVESHSSSAGGYLNYGAPDEPIERVRAAYGDTNFERLRQLKRRYDPHNLFRFNHNIPPAAA
jgi:FAD/FMN-containing dehydrogenase